MELKKQNKNLLKRIEQMERIRGEEFEAESNLDNSKKEDKNAEILKAICKRLEALESRDKRIPCEERDGEENSREQAFWEGGDSARPTFRVGENAVVNAELPKGGWLRNPFKELKYSGRNNPQNPIKFLNRFEKIARYEEVGFVEQLYYFGRCFRGTASNWFEVREPEDIEDAKEAFKDYFWGEEQQARFREDIYLGSYKNESGMLMLEYALNLSKQAK